MAYDAHELESSTVKYNYDVFFSFSSQDFETANYLYTALRDAGCRIIRDGDIIERTTNIDSDVNNLIEMSKICVVLLSKSYVSSRWCLDQLVTTIELRKNLTFPIFYDIDPSEFSSQNGRFEGALSRFEDQLKMENDFHTRNKLTNKINEWSEALSFAADVPGFVLPDQTEGYELSLIETILHVIDVKLKDAEESETHLEAENSLDELMGEDWTGAEISLRNIEELPKNLSCPFLVKLIFQHCNDLTEIPNCFFQNMPILDVLDLSGTSIKTLPQSIASLKKLRQFFLRDCVLLTELPAEIQELSSLMVFDLEGTKLSCLPEEIGMLSVLESLKFSLSGDAAKYVENKGIKAIIPRMTLSKCYNLKQLSIFVDPDCAWWDAEVEAIIEELPWLRKLRNSELYFPTPTLMQNFFKITSSWLSVDFSLTVGPHEQHIISSLPLDLQSTFKKLHRCLVYVNGKGDSDAIDDSLQHVGALFLDRQWTMEELFDSGSSGLPRLLFCMVVECNKMTTIVGEVDSNLENSQLQCLQYLSVHYMKNLRSIWRGTTFGGSFYCLEILALHTCPELITILNANCLCKLLLLKELIVENCPKVESLVSGDTSGLGVDTYFLPSLKNILIADLPELVSISGGLKIGPELERIDFSNCPKLKNLSPKEVIIYEKYMHESEWLDEVESCNNEIAYLRKFAKPTSYDDFMKEWQGKDPFQDQVSPRPSFSETHIEKHKDLSNLGDKSIQHIDFGHSMAHEAHKGSTSKYNYDVFFSFSSQDYYTANYLYTTLNYAGLRIIRDGDMIERKIDINSEMRNLIEQSKISVVVLSKSYVSSRWCLDQLVMIIRAKYNLILPVFYGVDPSDVRSKKGRIGEGFSRLEDQLKMESDPEIRNNLINKIEEWSEALSFAADLSKSILSDQARGDESLFTDGFIRAVAQKVIIASDMEVETSLGEFLNQEEPSSLVKDSSAAEITLTNVKELSGNPNCPFLVKLLFQESNDLMEIPDSFFENMPILEVLDLSNTSIKKLPRSIASLGRLREMYVKDCMLLTELPLGIKELSNLEVFDLEGTELNYLPKEIGRLHKLKCLKFSLSKCADEYTERKEIKEIIPRAILSELYLLEELSIVVDPDCEWWSTEVEAVIDDLDNLTNLKRLRLQLPIHALLQKFMNLSRRVYSCLSNFTLTVGRCNLNVISSLPRDLHTSFEELDNCLIYVNGKGNTDEIGEALKHAKALFLDRQWSMTKLSEFKADVMRRLQFCLMVECNEMNTIVDGDFLYNKSILESLRYLSVHRMKNLQSIWWGANARNSLSKLEILSLHACPELTTIFNPDLLRNLIYLKELIVEDCPKVRSLVSGDLSGLESFSYFLPALKKIILDYLPELISISSGFRIAPKIEKIVFSNCPKLKNLSPEEDNMYGQYLHEIKEDNDEIEWSNETEVGYVRYFRRQEYIDSEDEFQSPFPQDVVVSAEVVYDNKLKQKAMESESVSQDSEDDIFQEFQSLLLGETDFPLDSGKYKAETNTNNNDAVKLEKDKIYEAELANSKGELDRLRNTVKVLMEREASLEGQLFEYYCLNEQESHIFELKKNLKIKTAEIDMLNATVTTLQAEKKKLQEEISEGVVARKELEVGNLHSFGKREYVDSEDEFQYPIMPSSPIEPALPESSSSFPSPSHSDKDRRRFAYLRGVQWRIDLGVLSFSSSSSIDDLRRATANSRRRYAKLRRRLVVDPHIPKDGSNSPDLVMDNPLSQNPDSMRSRFFRSAELEMVDQDLSHLYPEHGSYFQTPACQGMLRRILLLWCLRHPECGYRQGMHELVAPLLYVLHIDIENLSQVREDHFTDKFDELSFNESDLTYIFDFKKLPESITEETGLRETPKKATTLDELDPKIQSIVMLSDAYGAEGELGIVISDKFMEHDAYCLFDALMKGSSSGAVAMAEFFSPSPSSGSHTGLPPVLEASSALYHLLSMVDSSLHSHLVELGVEPQYFSLRWLRVLFGREFALKDLLIVWDEIFACDNKKRSDDVVDDDFIIVLNSSRGAFISALAVSMILHVKSSLLATESATSCLQRLLNFPEDINIEKLISKAKSLQSLMVDANYLAPLPANMVISIGHGVSSDSANPAGSLAGVVPESYWEEKWRVMHNEAEEQKKQGSNADKIINKQIKGWSERVRLRPSRSESVPTPSKGGNSVNIDGVKVRRNLLEDLARLLGSDEDDTNELLKGTNDNNSLNFSAPPSPNNFVGVKGDSVDHNEIYILKNLGQSMLENIQVIESVFQQDRRGQTQSKISGSQEQLSKNDLVGRGHVTAMAALTELKNISNLLSEI